MRPDRGGGHLRGTTCIKCVNNVKHDLRKARLTIGLSSRGYDCHVLVVRVSLFGTERRWGC